MRAAQFLAIIGRGSKGSNALENTEDRARATSEQQDNVINTVNSLDPYGPSWQLVPGNVAAGTVYAQVPTSGTGDLTFTRASTANRTNSAGNIVNVASGVGRVHYRNADGSLSSTGRLLLEPPRTNLVTFSEMFSDVAWTKLNSTISANTTIAPNGTLTADTITANVGTPISSNVDFATATGTGNFTASIFAKKGSVDWLYIRQGNSGGGTSVVRAWFNLNTGTIGSTSPAAISRSIEDYGNGWYRCSMTFSVLSGGVPRPQFYLSTGDGVTTLNSDGSQFFYLWGAQLEAAAYASSYIPTTTAAVTRLADAASKTGVSSLIGQTEGTVYFDFVYNFLDTSVAQLFSISDETVSNRLFIGFVFNNLLTAQVRNGGSTQAQIESSSLTVGNRYKAAVGYKQNDIVFYINGVQIGTDLSANIPACNRIAFDNGAGSSNFTGTVNQAALFTRRLTNAELAAITTL
jgi:hypothetical protein